MEKQRRELARRDMARTEWIAGVSHDIRTPLSLIAGYADEMEKEAGLPEETRRRADLIRRQSFVIKKLIEDLNLTSRLTYHMKPLRKERYCPAELLRKTAAGMLNSGEIGENWELEAEVAPELETLQMTGDTALLMRALKTFWGTASGTTRKDAGFGLRRRKRKTDFASAWLITGEAFRRACAGSRWGRKEKRNKRIGRPM